MLVKYYVQGNSNGQLMGFHSEYNKHKKMTLDHLIKSFPEPGKFHFRAKVNSETVSYIWKDLVELDTIVPSYHGEIIIKALPMYFDDELENHDQSKAQVVQHPVVQEQHIEVNATTEVTHSGDTVVENQQNGFEQTWQEEEEASIQEDEHNSDSDLSSSSEDEFSSSDDGHHDEYNITSKNVEDEFRRPTSSHTVSHKSSFSAFREQATGQDVLKKISTSSIGGFFKASAKAARNLATEVSKASLGTAIPNSAELKVLHGILNEMTTPYSPRNHEKYLEDLWKAAFRDAPFQTKSEEWKKLGAQSSDPLKDLRGAGVLGLKCMVYFGISDNHTFRKIYKSQRQKSNDNYPMIAAAMNITRSLASLLHIDGGIFESKTRPFWGMFTSKQVFYELFVIQFKIVHNMWMGGSFTIADFPKVITTSSKHIKSVLSEGPTTVDQLYSIADAMGIPI